ncbi:MAG: translocase [Planctomycetaceae bacterium]
MTPQAIDSTTHPEFIVRGLNAARVTDALLRLYHDHVERSLTSLELEADLLRQKFRGPRNTLSQANRFQGRMQAIALAGVAVQKTFGFHPHGVQLWGALLVADGRIAEMQTGEGKTIVTGLAAFARSLEGDGVHVATTNSYLAQRDCEELRPVFRLLGCSCGLIPGDADLDLTRNAYACDVTYGTGYQFGFDYLRDQLIVRTITNASPGSRTRAILCGDEPPIPPIRQRGHAYAILDEIDSVLIDEAATPLVLSGPADSQESPYPYHIARQAVDAMVEERDYLIEANGRILFHEEAIARSFERLNSASTHPLARSWTLYLSNAMQAKRRFEKDVHYVVRGEEVCIVDQNTGRIFSDRSWRDGLHQAVQAKEGVPIKPSESSVARITRQRYFQKYAGLGGLTGTAVGSEAEFAEFYGRTITRVPPARPCLRQEFPTRYFDTIAAKRAAIVTDVITRHQTEQPILLGTRTIQESLCLSRSLAQHGVPHRLLNGLQDQDEAEIIGEAGTAGRVTIATNMAGRGTDIRLRGAVAKQLGLHVLATERHESSRVDRQLAGRAARQGQPGSAQFFVSAEDELISQHAPRLMRRMQSAAGPLGEVIHHRFDSAVADLQRRQELIHFQRRQQLVALDIWGDDIRESMLGASVSI